MKKIIFSLCIGAISIAFTFLSEKPFEGVIEYSVNVPTKPGAKPNINRFTVYIKGDKLRIDNEVSFGMIRTIMDFKKDNYLMLYITDNGKKYVQKAKKEISPPNTAEVRIMKDSSKILKGFKCDLAMTKMKNREQVMLFANKHNLPLAYTKLPGGFTYGMTGVHPKLDDKLILSLELSDTKNTITIRVETIKETMVSNNMFEYSQKDFKEVSKEEINKLIEQAFNAPD